jgi:hypothetical protein
MGGAWLAALLRGNLPGTRSSPWSCHPAHAGRPFCGSRASSLVTVRLGCGHVETSLDWGSRPPEQVLARRVVHSNDPLLSTQVGAASKSAQGDAWRFTRKGSGHVDAVYAAQSVHPRRGREHVDARRLLGFLMTRGIGGLPVRRRDYERLPGTGQNGGASSSGTIVSSRPLRNGNRDRPSVKSTTAMGGLLLPWTSE